MVTGIKALSQTLSLCWELTGPYAGVDRGLSTDGDDEEETYERLVGSFCEVCIGSCLSRGRPASGGCFQLWTVWSRNDRVPEKFVIHIVEIVRYI